ncbi:hypothetical protein [Candidatus Oleimmundimicrobium sp.]|uniref:hypothetical protein n=1 Tax=Candidatus Oleimmundimicrobium sp. TaxID=3060597 RepID=UPI002719D1A4|nr:hypothetical protein [Candidatus Oleimmundimicrobium sp.]MDO8885747.1 hypothetical protein [Candidatus Oleimmundimicrobium sp.]
MEVARIKTRIIYTKFWQDNYISDLKAKEKLAFIYFITNEKVNICGIYELPDKYIRLGLDLTVKELDTIKEKLSTDNKFLFIDGWIKIVNFEFYNKFIGEKNEIAKEKELALIPARIIEYQYPTPYPTDRVSLNGDTLNNHKPITNNHKLITINPKSKPLIPFAEIQNLWNEKTELAKIVALSKTRKEKIKLRWEEHPDLSEWATLFITITDIKFLHGENERNWRADFDWVMSNDTNWLKIIEGKYTKQEQKKIIIDMTGDAE